MFFIGFGLSFILGWNLALILSGVIPFLALTGAGMAAALSSGVTEMMRAYAQSAGYAEQALTAIRVVQSYGQEDLEKMNYEKYLYRAAQVQRKSAFTKSGGLSLLYIIILGFYAYSFYFGGFCRWTDDDWFINPRTDKKYTGGEIIGLMFMIMFAIMQMTGMGPEMAAITEAKIGGKMAYDVIDHVPSV